MLNELLGAVRGQDELARKVADLYVFMAKLLVSAEQKQSIPELTQLRSLLEIEAETWSLVCQAQNPISPPVPHIAVTSSEGGFCLDA